MGKLEHCSQWELRNVTKSGQKFDFSICKRFDTFHIVDPTFGSLTSAGFSGAFMLYTFPMSPRRQPSIRVKMAVHSLEKGCIGKCLGSPRISSNLSGLGVQTAKSPPSGNLSVLGGCISKYIPPLGSVRIHYLIIIKEVLILTLSLYSLHWRDVFLDVYRQQGRYWHDLHELRDQIIQYTPFSLGSVLENTANIIPVAIKVKCQEIHPCTAVNIDSVKINTSLIMMRVCEIQTSGRVYTLCQMTIVALSCYLFVFLFCAGALQDSFIYY